MDVLCGLLQRCRRADAYDANSSCEASMSLSGGTTTSIAPLGTPSFACAPGARGERRCSTCTDGPPKHIADVDSEHTCRRATSSAAQQPSGGCGASKQRLSATGDLASGAWSSRSGLTHVSGLTYMSAGACQPSAYSGALLQAACEPHLQCGQCCTSAPGLAVPPQPTTQLSGGLAHTGGAQVRHLQQPSQLQLDPSRSPTNPGQQNQDCCLQHHHHHEQGQGQGHEHTQQPAELQRLSTVSSSSAEGWGAPEPTVMPPELKQQLAQERGAVAGGEEPLEPHGNGEDVNAGASSTSGGPPRGASRRILESAALDDGFSFSFSTLASTTGGVSSVARPFSSATGAPTAGGSAYGVGGSSACQSYQQQQLMPDSAGTGRGVARLPPSTAALVAAAKLRGTGQSSSAAGHRTWSAALSRESASSQQGPCDRVCGSSSGNSACCRSRRSRFSQEHERHMSAADVPLEAAAASGEQARCVLRGGAANQQPSMKANARTLAGLMHVRSPGETAIQAGLRGPYSDAPLALSPPQRLLGGEVQPERQQQPRPQWLHLQTLPLATVAASGGTATSNSGLFQGLVVKAEEVSKAASSSNAGLPSNVWGQALAAGLRVAPGVEEDEEDEAEAANAGDGAVGLGGVSNVGLACNMQLVVGLPDLLRLLPPSSGKR